MQEMTNNLQKNAKMQKYATIRKKNAKLCKNRQKQGQRKRQKNVQNMQKYVNKGAKRCKICKKYNKGQRIGKNMLKAARNCKKCKRMFQKNAKKCKKKTRAKRATNRQKLAKRCKKLQRKWAKKMQKSKDNAKRNMQKRVKCPKNALSCFLCCYFVLPFCICLAFVSVFLLYFLCFAYERVSFRGENADFGGPELINLFLLGGFFGKRYVLCREKVFGRHFWRLFTGKFFWAILFFPDSFSPVDKTRSYFV